MADEANNLKFIYSNFNIYVGDLLSQFNKFKLLISLFMVETFVVLLIM